MNSTTETQRADLDALQAQLASRMSILHLAHGAVSAALAVIFGGSAIKLYVDQLPWLMPAVVTTAVLSIYAAVRFVLGRKALRRERQLFEQMQLLRRALNLEDPSALLPQ